LELLVDSEGEHVKSEGVLQEKKDEREETRKDLFIFQKKKTPPDLFDHNYLGLSTSFKNKADGDAALSPKRENIASNCHQYLGNYFKCSSTTFFGF